MKHSSSLVIFGDALPSSWGQLKKKIDTVIAKEHLRQVIEKEGISFIPLEGLITPGSIYEASKLIEEMSLLELSPGSRLSKSFTYKGYELWWIHYNSLYLHFCLPFTQYATLLKRLTSFDFIYFSEPPFPKLFSCYLRAYEREVIILPQRGVRSFSFLPFGVFLQMLITLISIPFLILSRSQTLIFIGDKFEEGRDHDFRMRFIYEELRKRNFPFTEFIRSLESWKNVLTHAWVRKRPVVYSEAVAFMGRFISILFGGNVRARHVFNSEFFSSIQNREQRFKLLIASQHLFNVGNDIWAIRIMKGLLRLSGIRAAFIAASLERNFHTVLAAKLLNISITGILHGFASRSYNGYDFLPTYDGEKSLSVDKYGVWSEWWKKYYLRYGKTYREDQLYVSGLMRPFIKTNIPEQQKRGDKIKVLFISEQLSVPEEVMPYLTYLLQQKEVELTIKFRPSRDGFEQWLLKHNPSILKDQRLTIIRGTMQEAIQRNDIVVGNNSTAVIEALLALKPIVLYHSQKWGDYFELEGRDSEFHFFARNPEELLQCIKSNQAVPKETLKKLQEQFFGDPYKNGSEWVVNQLIENLRTSDQTISRN